MVSSRSASARDKRRKRPSQGAKAGNILCEIWREASRDLTAAGIEDAHLDAEVLLRFSLGLSRASFLAYPDREIGSAELIAFRSLLRRRLAREPLAYITGSREFYGLELAVDKRVLVPRPETELLVEVALGVLQERVVAGYAAPVMVDVGTGTGAIPVALATRLFGIKLFAIDSSADALAVAAVNLRRHGMAERIALLQGDLLAPLSEPVDLIVANLPYIPSSRIPTLQPEVAKWEPRLALSGGEDGLDLIRRLLDQADLKLRRPGAILLEADPEQMDSIATYARRLWPQVETRIHRDLVGRERVMQLEVG